MLKLAIASLVLLGTAAPALAQRLQAEADCSATDTALTYHCMIEVTQAGTPVEGAEFTVKADMPEMPMAHNIAPVPAEPTAHPGTYHVPLQLEMPGKWMLKLEFTAPQRDLVVIDREFLPELGTMDAGGHKHSGHGAKMGQ